MIKIIIKVTKNQINYTKDQLKAAIKTVMNKEKTFAETGREYNIPYGTISAHVNGRSKSFEVGHPTLFSKAQEQQICETLLTLADADMPLNDDEVI
jgi:hypothetical protein